MSMPVRGAVLAAGALALAGVGAVIGASSASAVENDPGTDGGSGLQAITAGPESGHQQAVNQVPASQGGSGPASTAVSAPVVPDVATPAEATVGQWYQAATGAPSASAGDDGSAAQAASADASPVQVAAPRGGLALVGSATVPDSPAVVALASDVDAVSGAGASPSGTDAVADSPAPVQAQAVSSQVSSAETSLAASPVVVTSLSSSVSIGTSAVQSTLTQWYQAPSGGDGQGTDAGPTVPVVSPVNVDVVGSGLGVPNASGLGSVFNLGSGWLQGTGAGVGAADAPVLPVDVPVLPAWSSDPGAQTIINLGDSYASGEGAGIYANDGTWLGLTDTQAHQSLTNKAQVMAADLRSWTGNDVNVLDLSHSGSISAGQATYPAPDSYSDGLLKVDTWARGDTSKIVTLEEQINYLEQKYPGELPQGAVVVGIGGNDIAFADVASKTLVLNGDPVAAQQSVVDAYALMPDAMDRYYDQLTRIIDKAPDGYVIYVTGYPYLANASDLTTISGCQGICSADDPLGLLGGTTVEFEPAPALRALNDTADYMYAEMVGRAQSYADIMTGKHITIVYKPASVLTDGGAPYLTNGAINPDTLINPAFHNALGFSANYHEYIHPTPAEHAIIGDDLALQFCADTGSCTVGSYGSSIPTVRGTWDAAIDSLFPSSSGLKLPADYDLSSFGPSFKPYSYSDSLAIPSVQDSWAAEVNSKLPSQGLKPPSSSGDIGLKLPDSPGSGGSNPWSSDSTVGSWMSSGSSLVTTWGSPLTQSIPDFWPQATITSSRSGGSSGAVGSMAFSALTGLAKGLWTDPGLPDDKPLRVMTDALNVIVSGFTGGLSLGLF